VQAFELAQRAGERGEAVPDSLARRFTDLLTVLSEPADAVVRVLRFDGLADPATGTWLELGPTPLRGVAVPRGDYHVRVEADGHAPMERILSSANTRGAFGNRLPSGIQMDVRLLPFRSRAVRDGARARRSLPHRQPGSPVALHDAG
jgi:hypothetical protein